MPTDKAQSVAVRTRPQAVSGVAIFVRGHDHGSGAVEPGVDVRTTEWKRVVKLRQIRRDVQHSISWNQLEGIHGEWHVLLL